MISLYQLELKPVWAKSFKALAFHLLDFNLHMLALSKLKLCGINIVFRLVAITASVCSMCGHCRRTSSEGWNTLPLLPTYLSQTTSDLWHSGTPTSTMWSTGVSTITDTLPYMACRPLSMQATCSNHQVVSYLASTSL